MGRFTNLPTPKDLMSMKEDLEFKEDEMKKSEMTTIELAAREYTSIFVDVGWGWVCVHAFTDKDKWGDRERISY